MDAHFEIRVDAQRDLVHITLSGFFLAEDIARFQAARDTAHARLRCAPNRHVTITDIREMKVQAQESVMAFASLLSDPTQRSRKLAFIVGPSLARSQLMRAATGRSDTRFFGDPHSARAWLFAHDEAEPPLQRRAARS